MSSNARKPGFGEAAPRLAIVDIGTNTIKFSTFEVSRDGSSRLIASDSETVRLGADIDRTGRISEERSHRAIIALQRFEQDARNLETSIFIGVATEAFRSASNGADVLAAIHVSTAWRLRVIDGAEESRLTFRGLQPQLAGSAECVVADVGGGSTELLHVSGGSLAWSESVPIGSGRFADAYFTNVGLTEMALRRAREAAKRALNEAIPGVPERLPLVLSGGNGVFLAALSWHFTRRPGFSIESVESVARELIVRPASEIAKLLSISTERATVLPAGCAISLGAIDALGSGELVAAPSGIREGILRDWLEAHGYEKPASVGHHAAGQVE